MVRVRPTSRVPCGVQGAQFVPPNACVATSVPVPAAAAVAVFKCAFSDWTAPQVHRFVGAHAALRVFMSRLDEGVLGDGSFWCKLAQRAEKARTPVGKAFEGSLVKLGFDTPHALHAAPRLLEAYNHGE